MANVIIGLIGVILFIGVAMAATNYLGANFMQANGSRNATVVLSSLRQTSDAIKTYRLVSRNVTPNTTMFINTLISANALKVAPNNPNRSDAPTVSTIAGAWPYPVYNGGPGNNAAFSSTVTFDNYIVMDLGPSSSANATCVSVQKTVGSSRLTTTSAMAVQATFADQTNAQPTSGCFSVSAGVPGATAGDYVAYIQD